VVIAPAWLRGACVASVCFTLGTESSHFVDGVRLTHL
jgi:hypothetical protein